MEKHIYIIGVFHQIQHENGIEGDLQKKIEIQEFKIFIDQLISLFNVDCIGEEFNEDACKISKVKESVLKNHAASNGINHIYCDPTFSEREDLNIKKDEIDKRECFMVDKLLLNIGSCNSILFVCGKNHSIRLQKKFLRNPNIVCEIINTRTWGSNL